VGGWVGDLEVGSADLSSRLPPGAGVPHRKLQPQGVRVLVDLFAAPQQTGSGQPRRRLQHLQGRQQQSTLALPRALSR